MIWLSASFLLGVSENLFVLYSTVCHKALKMDKMSVWIIQNVSVADICNCVFVVLPVLITQFNRGTWVFGNILCNLKAAYNFSFFVANIFLLTILSLNKLIRCMFPLRNMSPSRKQRYTVTMATVILSAIPMSYILFQIYRHESEVYVPNYWEENVCAFAICLLDAPPRNEPLNPLAIALYLILDVLMSFIMIVTNAILLVYAIKMTNRPVVKKNVIMVIAMCAIFLITFLPVPLSFLVLHGQGEIVDEIAWSLAFVSVWINPWIHYAMNEKFRKFAKNKILFWKRSEATMSTNNQQAQTAL